MLGSPTNEVNIIVVGLCSSAQPTESINDKNKWIKP
jgi:hypothetical protein